MAVPGGVIPDGIALGAPEACGMLGGGGGVEAVSIALGMVWGARGALKAGAGWDGAIGCALTAVCGAAAGGGGALAVAASGV